MTKIDWSGELEAYHEDGRVVSVKCYGISETGKQFIRMEFIGGNFTMMQAALDGYIGSGWRIRNRQPATNDRLARLEAFVARVASDEPGGRNRYREEAKALVAEIAPVDPDVSAAKEMAFDAQDDFVTPLASARLERLERHILSAIKRGRSLERGEP